MKLGKPAFAVEGIIKDFECAIRTAKALGVRFMLAPVAQQLCVEAAARGHAKGDVTSVILPMEEIAGVLVRDRDASEASQPISSSDSACSMAMTFIRRIRNGSHGPSWVIAAAANIELQMPTRELGDPLVLLNCAARHQAVATDSGGAEAD